MSDFWKLSDNTDLKDEESNGAFDAGGLNGSHLATISRFANPSRKTHRCFPGTGRELGGGDAEIFHGYGCYSENMVREAV